MEFTHKIPSVEAYNQLRVNAGMNSTKPHSEVKKALEGTLFLVSVYEEDELIGLGRICWRWWCHFCRIRYYGR